MRGGIVFHLDSRDDFVSEYADDSDGDGPEQQPPGGEEYQDRQDVGDPAAGRRAHPLRRPAFQRVHAVPQADACGGTCS